MAEIVFKDLSFERDKDRIKVNFLRLFYTYLDEKSLEKIDFEASANRMPILGCIIP